MQCFLRSGRPIIRGIRKVSTTIVLSQERTSSSETEETIVEKGYVVGCYDGGDNKGFELSEGAKKLDSDTKGTITQLLNVSGGKINKGDVRLFYDVSPAYSHVAVVGVGPRVGACEPEEETQTGNNAHLYRENVRRAVAVATKTLQTAKVKNIYMEDFTEPEAAGEGATLAKFSFDNCKSKNKKPTPELNLIGNVVPEWSRGVVLGSAQNFARELMEMPSNLMTPTLFVETVQEKAQLVRGEMEDAGRLQIIPRSLSWIQDKKMGAFLCVSQGSPQVPWFLEMRLNFPENVEVEDGKQQKPVVLVGKGITFDTGGVSIKPASGMGLMRGDMGGGACVASALLGLAALNVGGPVVGLIPLCENTVSGGAVKPGDVVTSMSGTTIEVDNTDAEGRLILADALTYAKSLRPEVIVDLATLTGAMMVALGNAAAGVFTNSTPVWQKLHKASAHTGDYLWRMPLYSQYTKQIESQLADISNVGTKGRYAGACTAAAFLQEFVDKKQPWAHIDIAGVMDSHGELPYLSKGMSGRPTRTLIQFVESHFK